LDNITAFNHHRCNQKMMNMAAYQDYIFIQGVKLK